MTNSLHSKQHLSEHRFCHSFIILHSSFLIFIALCSPVRASSDSDRTSIAVEAITKLQHVDLEQNAKLKDTVHKLLEKTRGTPDFLKLVKHFKITAQEPALLDLAASHPSDETGIEALRLVLGGPNHQLIEQRLRGANTNAATALAEALGNSGSKDAVALLLPILRDDKADVALRRQSVRALARSEAGAEAILELARAGQLDDALRFPASSELTRARWDRIKREAAKLLPLPAAQNNQPLPPLSELLGRTGVVENGRRVFFNSSAGCASCHRAAGHGTDVGPDLSEIGSKLAKEALYESILDPSAGISFGFEAWQIELQNGDELYGIVTSETADELVLKNSAGISTTLKKSDLKSRQQMKLSMMPADLQQAMTTQQLVDLIEFLASLKKPGS